MKRHFFILAILLSALTVGYAQRFIGFAAAGANFAQIEGDDIHGFTKLGANAGLGLKLPVNRKQNLNVTVELLYSQKGSYKHCTKGYFDTLNYSPVAFAFPDADIDRNEPFNPNIKCNLSLDYVQIPVMFRYEDFYTGFTFGLGFSWSRLVRVKEKYNGFTSVNNIRTSPYKYNDWSIVADVDIRLYKNLSLGIRWDYSLRPIREMQVGFVKGRIDGVPNVEYEYRKLFNHVVSCRLVYYINEKFMVNSKTNNKGERMGTKYVREIPEY